MVSFQILCSKITLNVSGPYSPQRRTTLQLILDHTVFRFLSYIAALESTGTTLAQRAHAFRGQFL